MRLRATSEMEENGKEVGCFPMSEHVMQWTGKAGLPVRKYTCKAEAGRVTAVNHPYGSRPIFVSKISLDMHGIIQISWCANNYDIHDFVFEIYFSVMVSSFSN